MPWKEIGPMDERARFIVECLRGELTMSELCQKYEVSRKTGYKWWARFAAEGRGDLADRSHAARAHPNATPDPTVTVVVDARKAHPTWGPRKLRAWLTMKYPRLALPAPSTLGAILKRQGLARPRRPRRRPPPYGAPFLPCAAPNAVWCADFKGSFVLGNGRRCNPLTISDAHSRYLLRCEALTYTDEGHVRPIFESAFCEFGRPQAIRTDNGPPFGTVAAGGLSRLALWWLKLGIRPERIAPGQPQQNGRHERMHRTLKAEATRPPARTLAEQQLAFDRFRRIYNHERPHEALGQCPPGSVYNASTRCYPVRLRAPVYRPELRVRTVRHDGMLLWKGKALYLAETLAGEPVGLEELTGDQWRVYFADIVLGVIEAHRFRRTPITRTPRTPLTTGNPRSVLSPIRPV
jgi:transposase InsO family protein